MDLDLKEVMKEYDNLFDLVPCLITVHDREYRIIKYNKEFKDKFAPEPGTFCYEAYKDRKRKCENCPVEKTFKDGKSHYSEEKGINKDNSAVLVKDSTGAMHIITEYDLIQAIAG